MRSPDYDFRLYEDYGGPLVPWEQRFLSGVAFIIHEVVCVACLRVVWFGRHKLMFNTFSTLALCKGTVLHIFSK